MTKSISNLVQEFYDEHPFPGTYTKAQLTQHGYPLSNRYLCVIDEWVTGNKKNILDVGCGTGLISNLFADRTKNNFTGIDFSNGVEYASQYAKQHDLHNVEFIQQDFFDFTTSTRYDVIICQSFLTHVQNPDAAILKLKSLLTDNGVLILGVYNSYGKILKKFFNINYRNNRLKLDQEHNPYEVSFSHNRVMNMCSDLQLLHVSPSFGGKFIALRALMNSINGGLTMYVFKKD